MKKTILLLAVIVAFSATVFAQSKTTKTYQMYLTNWMKPKRGHEKQFEAAVKAHNAKFHATAPYTGRLSIITEGSGSDGWYIWTMGPFMYADLDHQPDGTKEHDDDWNNTVDTQVEQYGESNFWKLQDDISFTPPNYLPDRIDVWSMQIKPGMRFQFTELMKKWKGLWDAKKYPYSMRVFYNDLFRGGNANASIVYSFSKYSDFDLDIKWRDDYEALYGAGSWDSFWKTWNESVASTDEHLRKFLK